MIMKKYIKPSIEELAVAPELMETNSIASLTGLDGVTLGDVDFTGGIADSRDILGILEAFE